MDFSNLRSAGNRTGISRFEAVQYKTGLVVFFQYKVINLGGFKLQVKVLEFTLFT